LTGIVDVSSQSVRDRVFIGAQYLLPQHFLSRLIGSLARAQAGWLKRALIRGFLRHYPVDLSEAERSKASDYESFNDFFTRRLRQGARPIDHEPAAVVCPVDGYVSQAGACVGDGMLQAKGISYSVNALLGGDAALAAQFAGGTYATLYLAPHNYHRIHMPLAGTLRLARHVPGDLFSVNAATAEGVPGLFTRNERIVCVFDTSAGPMAIVLVGALFVGSMSLSWAGEIRRQHRRRMRELPVRPVIALDKGAELGWFNMGSTVVLMFAVAGPVLEPGLAPGRPMRMGERIATCS
jgi:phosphatidylserine decarboxylase